jgi:hypothetical protein
MRKNSRNLHVTFWRRKKCHALLKMEQQEMIG